MFHLLVFLLSLCQLSPVTFSETINTSKFSINDLNNDDYNYNTPKTQTELPLLQAIDYPLIKTINNDETEIDFNNPMASSDSIDDLNNAINMLKQRQKQQAMSMNSNFLRFGKRQVESMPAEQALESFEPGTRFERSNGGEGSRESRRDQFIRFGRSSGSKSQFMRLGRTLSDFMRFGRMPSDFMRFGRTPSDFMRFGRAASDLMRFGRNPSDFMRFGRSAPSDFMRFGRSDPSDFMRFGRSAPSDFMRFGRTPSDFMRFGRTPSDFMRFGRTPSDFMRFGRTPSDFMRFGRVPSTSFMRLGRSQDEMMHSSKSNKLSAPSAMEKNFMRSGRPDSFIRFGRSSSTDTNTNPNFMRFGKRQKNETSQKPSQQNQINKVLTSEESTTSFPYHELENEVDPIDMMFLNDLTDSENNK